MCHHVHAADQRDLHLALPQTNDHSTVPGPVIASSLLPIAAKIFGTHKFMVFFPISGGWWVRRRACAGAWPLAIVCQMPAVSAQAAANRW